MLAVILRLVPPAPSSTMNKSSLARDDSSVPPSISRDVIGTVPSLKPEPEPLKELAVATPETDNVSAVAFPNVEMPVFLRPAVVV